MISGTRTQSNTKLYVTPMNRTDSHKHQAANTVYSAPSRCLFPELQSPLIGRRRAARTPRRAAFSNMLRTPEGPPEAAAAPRSPRPACEWCRSCIGDAEQHICTVGDEGTHPRSHCPDSIWRFVSPLSDHLFVSLLIPPGFPEQLLHHRLRRGFRNTKMRSPRRRRGGQPGTEAPRAT